MIRYAIILYYTVLFYNVLYYSMLYYIILYYSKHLPGVVGLLEEAPGGAGGDAYQY